jgi:hypothetical protein
VTFYKEVFAVRPYPMGDAAPYRDPLMGPNARPPGDPAGASTHFFADYGNVRFVFIDNSCYGIVNCDPLQNPPDDRGRSQYQFLRDSAAEAKAQGRLVFVVMHMPTRDPRDQSESYVTSRNHVMGKGGSPDNQTFEQEAEALKVDGVLLGHIKGQFQYLGRGDIPYYIDGGAGGELYTTGPLGVDHGYWYGFRLLRVDGRSVTTDVVPVIAPGGIAVEGPTVLERPSGIVRYQAFARQPATASKRAVVKALELRGPDPVPVSGSGGVPGWIVWLAPLLLVPVLALTAGLQERAPRRRLARTAAVAGLGLLATAGLAGAQRSDPTSTPKEALPNPARIFTTGDPRILAPSASATDDPRRDTRTQTADGAFVPGCPGHTRVTVTSGWEQGFTAVRVKSNPGRILRRFDRRASLLTRGRTARVAAVRLEQAAIVEAVVRRGGRTVARLGGACLGRGAHAVRWRPGRGLKAGAYRLEVRVRSDRPTMVRRAPLRVD